MDSVDGDLDPLAVKREHAGVYRSGHAIGGGRVAFVYHCAPGSECARVVVGESRNGVMPFGKHVVARFEHAERATDQADLLVSAEKTHFVDETHYDPITEWRSDYWAACRRMRPG